MYRQNQQQMRQQLMLMRLLLLMHLLLPILRRLSLPLLTSPPPMSSLRSTTFRFLRASTWMLPVSRLLLSLPAMPG